MNIKIDDFEKGELIPEKYTCDGLNQRPVVHLDHISPNAQSLVIHCEDKDSPGERWSHWLMWNIQPTTEEILPGANPPGAIEGMTSFGTTGYGGPCPGSGEHRYYFTVYGVDIKLELPPDAKWPEVDKAMFGHILEESSYMGKYQRNAVYGEPEKAEENTGLL